MARRRPEGLLILLLLLTLVGGTAAVHFSMESRAPLLGGPHRIERRAGSALGRPPRGVPAPPRDSSGPLAEICSPADVLVRVVRARDGAPVAGAHVNLMDVASTWTGFADDRGEVRYSGVESGTCSVLAYADGYMDGRATILLVAGGNPEVVVPIGESPLVEGRVVSALDGSPIPGAEIRAGAMAGDMPGRASPPPVVADGEGAFRLRAGEEGLNLGLNVRAKGFAPKDQWFRLPSLADGGARAEIALDPAGNLRGVVRDPSGRPVAGARIEVLPAGAGYGTVHRFQETIHTGQYVQAGTWSNAAGAYSLDGLARGGLYLVAAHRAGFANSEEREVFLPEGEAEVVADLDLRPACYILAKWAHERLPIESWSSVSLRPDDVRDVIAWTSGQGSARFAEIAAGRYEVEVTGIMRGSAPVEVRAGETATVEIPLRPAQDPGGAGIDGFVVDAAGAPVKSASVQAVTGESGVPSGPVFMPATMGQRRVGGVLLISNFSAPSGAATTDAAGRFRIGGLKEGAGYRLSASTRGGYAAPADPVTAPASGVSLALSAFGRLKGRLVLPEGAARPRYYHVLLGGQDSPGPAGTVASAVFGTGEFETSPMVGGRFLVSAVAGEFLLPPRAVEVPAGVILDLGDLPMVTGTTLRGRVVDPAGVPVPGAIVFLRGFAGGVVAGSDGRFEIGPAPAGEVSLALSLPGGVSVVRSVAPPESGEVGDLVLPRGGVLRVRAAAADGRPLLGTVEVRGAATTLGRTDHLGRYSASFAAGEYHVAILDPADGKTVLAEAPASITEGSETRVELRAGK